MQELIPASVVHRIADFTSQRDACQLAECLLATVQELFAPRWAALYSVDPAEDDSVEFCAGMHAGVLADTPPAESFDTLITQCNVAVLPMRGRSGRLIGYLVLKRGRALGMAEQHLADDLFRIYDNTACLLREAQFDRLTGLLNRHTFETQLDRVLEMARRTSRRVNPPNGEGAPQVQRFFLGEIDIDHFKGVNDRYGHLYGDEVLLIVAQMLKANFRKSDLVFRFGGEEFVVIVVADDVERATLGFERLRKRIESHCFPQVGRITVSTGLTEIREVVDAPVHILGQADQALYYAKNHGRNRVCLYEALVQEGQLLPFQAVDDVTIF